MKKTYLQVGKVVGSHGIKGMVRVECWCDSPDFLRKFKKLYSAENSDMRMEVEKASAHKNIALVKFKNIDTVENAEALRGTVLYIFRDDAKLEKGRYFIEEIIGCKVYDSQNKTFYGIIKDISPTGANDIWHIEKDGIEYLFPSVPDFVDNVDIEKEVAFIKPPKGIFDDEN
ncbi:MAG: 16S rRNA processing protein RimM [Ruminococcaceae bacterium]|nr:16S rRNA processing protein RimM [Oscillospiraceae bacterium]